MLLRLSYLLLLLTLAAGAFFYVYFSRQNDPAPVYVGSERCGVCHTPASIGAQYRIWSTGPHGRAYRLLTSDSVQQYLRRVGLTTDSCVSCHTTLGRPALTSREEQLNAEGIGCERCHGPGSEYMYYNVMTDRPAFLARGGVVGSLDDCTQCHAPNLEESTSHCPFQLKDFNADSAWLEVRHAIPPKPEEPDTVQQLRES